MTAVQKKKLFLHMGPGFHAQIENELFSESYPNVKFWSQPQVSSFTQLQNEAENAFLSLGNEKTDLVVHSFGAQLVISLMQKFPEKIGNITILNSGVDPFECFLNIGVKLGIASPGQLPDLRTGMVANKMDLIFKVAMAPGFGDLYWYSPQQQKHYSELFAKFPPLDVGVFAGVFSDYLQSQSQFHKSLKPWNKEVKIITSENDCLLDFKKDVQPWKRFFPNAKWEMIKNSGHYAQFEDKTLPPLLFK